MVVLPSLHGVTKLTLIPFVMIKEKTIVIFALNLKKISLVTIDELFIKPR